MLCSPISTHRCPNSAPSLKPSRNATYPRHAGKRQLWSRFGYQADSPLHIVCAWLEKTESQHADHESDHCATDLIWICDFLARAELLVENISFETLLSLLPFSALSSSIIASLYTP